MDSPRPGAPWWRQNSAALMALILTLSLVAAGVVAVIRLTSTPGGTSEAGTAGQSAEASATAGADEPPASGPPTTACDAPEPLECVLLTVPLDHAAPESGETIEVAFASVPASGERRGAFVTAVGGPGVSGIDSASLLPPEYEAIGEHYDLVFFDHRGAGRSSPLECDFAVEILDPAWGDASPDALDLKNHARLFVDSCMSEVEREERQLAYYSTAQTVGDLDAFRQFVGDERLFLYGQSYGTLAVQAYAAAHPDRVAALIIDGPLDPQIGLPRLAVDRNIAFSAALDATLDGCSRDPACVEAFAGTDARTALDALTERLTAESDPLTYEFPLPGDETVPGTYTLKELRLVSALSQYAELERMLFLRALAAERQGNAIPLVRLTHPLYQSPGGVEPPQLPSEVAARYAMLCSDFILEGENGK